MTESITGIVSSLFLASVPMKLLKLKAYLSKHAFLKKSFLENIARQKS